jgi:Thioredoxin
MGTLRVPVTQHDHIRGPANAPVIVVEYGDYECPHCGLAHPIVNAVREHFIRQLRFVFRHFPLIQVHPNAETAAESAEFAGAQACGPRRTAAANPIGPGFARWRAGNTSRRCAPISSVACAAV